MGWDAARINTNTQAGAPPSEFLFHILSAGCVMMPFIKVGNYRPEVPLYWIWVQICSRSEASGCGDVQRMLSASKGKAAIVQPDPAEWRPSSTCYPIPPPRAWPTPPPRPQEPDPPCDYSSFSCGDPQQILYAQRKHTTAASLRHKDTKASFLTLNPINLLSLLSSDQNFHDAAAPIICSATSILVFIFNTFFCSG